METVLDAASIEACARPLYLQGALDEAVAEVDKILSDGKLLTAASLLSAEILLTADRPEEALSALTFALANTPETLIDYRRAGRVYLGALRHVTPDGAAEIIRRDLLRANFGASAKRHRPLRTPENGLVSKPGLALTLWSHFVNFRTAAKANEPLRPAADCLESNHLGLAASLLRHFNNPRIRYDTYGLMAACFPRPGAGSAFKKRSSIPSLEIVADYIDDTLCRETIDEDRLSAFVRDNADMPVLILFLMMSGINSARHRQPSGGEKKTLWLENTWQSRWLIDIVAERFATAADITVFSRYPLVAAASEGKVAYLSVWFGATVPGNVDVVLSTDDFLEDLIENTCTQRILVPHGQLWHIYSYDWTRAEQSEATRAHIAATGALRFRGRCDYVLIPQPESYLEDCAHDPRTTNNRFIESAEIQSEAACRRNTPTLLAPLDDRPQAPDVRVVSTGHPRLDRVITRCRERETSERIALIAPRGLFTLPPDRRDWYVSALETTIARLLQSHPEYRVVFREIPGSLGYEMIRKRFAADVNFEYSSVPDYVEQYAQSALLITDGSSVLYSFSMSRLRPVIVLDPKVDGLNRTIYGATIGEADLIDDAVADCLTRQDAIREALSAFREQNLANPEKSLERIIDVTSAILAGQPVEALSVRFRPDDRSA
ncbi:hypothetical protein [Breoghania sp. JC706]|uniref:hypothetical protein n=1 Tax=Breoghania sp. JC706 TaxID=3117732 RepID=UPI00300BB03B